MAEARWHHRASEQVCDLLQSDLDRGLTAAEAAVRLERYGPNVIHVKRQRPWWLLLLRQFHQPLTYVLMASVGVTLALGHHIDATVIAIVVVVNAVVGFLQESRAAHAIEALTRTVIAEATVLRDGSRHRLAASELVPGDIVILQPGDRVPADIRLFHVRDLQVDESALTGESVAVEKSEEVVGPDTILAERRNMAYTGTLVTFGWGAGIVVATASDTEMGHIAHLLVGVQESAPPLVGRIARFSRILLVIIMVLALLSFGIGVARGEPADEMFLAAIALAVGAIPEGLPVAVTITLAIGVGRMARRRAIMRRLAAVETLGSTTVICSDKTGTLTSGQMTVREIRAAGTYRLRGDGYVPTGTLDPGEGALPLDGNRALWHCLVAGLLCNDSRLEEREGRWQVQGDPTEGALIVAARKAGIDHAGVARWLRRLDAIPFASEHQYMATLHRQGHDLPRLVLVKGSAEAVLGRCVAALDAEGEAVRLDAGAIHAEADAMAREGMRVLAFAIAERPAGTGTIDAGELDGELIFTGLQGMLDPPRAEAIAAVDACQQAGITVKMITGDHAVTAAAIAAAIGIRGGSSVVTGTMIDETDDDGLLALARDASVFARVTPHGKLRLVEALQRGGAIVAMTGDGVNDAPALRQADVGIAMGQNGTDVAREAADVILTDDNFASIEAAVEEGRSIFENLTKFIVWTLPTNLGEGLVVLAAVLAGTTLPMTPVQILWVNMTTAVLLGLTLAFEPAEGGLMRRPPRDPGAPIVSRQLVERIVLVGALLLAGAFGLFELQLHLGASEAEAQTAAVNLFVIVEAAYLFNCRSLIGPALRQSFTSNRWVLWGVLATVLFQAFFTYVPIMHTGFGTEPLDAATWAMILGMAVATFVIVEIEKWWRRWRAAGNPARAPG